jgi:Flp pilus assembly pilin Flp
MILSALLTYLQSMFHNEEGQDLIEYSMIIVVIVLVAMVGMAALGGQIAAIWGQITGALGGGG